MAGTEVRVTVIAKRLSKTQQLAMVADARLICRKAPLVRPVTTAGQAMGVLVSGAGSLGWVGDGQYRYSETQANGEPWPPIPRWWVDLANDIAGPHQWDSAILNYYAPGTSLGWHVDKSERDTSLPIITFSLGDAAVWGTKPTTRHKPVRQILETGAITLLAGETRSYLHAIQRILPSPMFSPLPRPGRLSITMRVAG